MSENSSQKKLFGLNFLRAIAISMVFVYHYDQMFKHPQWTYVISKFWWTGVDLFFVLSGYLITSHLLIEIKETKQLQLRRFLIKRFFRIIPAYLFVLICYYFFPTIREQPYLADTWMFLTFSFNLLLDPHLRNCFSHAWSLCIEEQFYLALPLSLLLLVKTRKLNYWFIIILFLFFAGMAFRYFYWHYLNDVFKNGESFRIHWNKRIYYSTYSRLDGLLAGVTVAFLFHYKENFQSYFSKRNGYVFFAAIFTILLAYLICEDTYSKSATVIGFPLVVLGYALLLIVTINKENLFIKYKSAVIEKTASLSYAIYLIHKIAIHLTQKLLYIAGYQKESIYIFICCIIITFFASYLLNMLVEKPFMKLKDNLLVLTN